MLTWSKPNAIVPDEPLRWIWATLRVYTIVASAGIALAFAVISIQALLHHIATAGTGQIGRAEGSGDSAVVLIAMCILFGTATYFTGRLYGTVGYVACAAGFVVVCFTLAWVGGFGFG